MVGNVQRQPLTQLPTPMSHDFNSPPRGMSPLSRKLLDAGIPGLVGKITLRGATGCTVEDDRNEAQKQTHYLAVVARDSAMSGWGGARGGTSRCAWAFDHTKVNSDRVFDWVKGRKEMKHVALVDLRTYRPARGTAHFHVYVCNPGHPASGITRTQAGLTG